MCGIAGVYLLDGSLKVNLDSMLDTLLDGIEHRGGDATGFVALGDEGVLRWQKASCGARDFEKERQRVPEGTRTILAHTRWATQGLPAFMENNHPLKRGAFYVIHNGHINNDHELFKLAGRERFGQVDSEAVPARLASLGKLGALGTVMSEVEGGAAIAAVDETNPKDLALARGFQSPLFVLRTKKIVIFGSTEGVVKEAYTAHVGKLPKRAKIVAVKQGTLLHWKDGKLKESTFKAYSPPKVSYTLPRVTLPYQASSGQSLSETGGMSWSRVEEDWVECEYCQETISWREMEVRHDHEADCSFMFCSACAAEYDSPDVVDDDGFTIVGEATEVEFSDDLSEVNREILRKLGADLREVG